MQDYTENDPSQSAKESNDRDDLDDDDDLFDRETTEELKVPNTALEKKTKSYTPISKGKFYRRKDLENTIGKGNTLGGIK